MGNENTCHSRFGGLIIIVALRCKIKWKLWLNARFFCENICHICHMNYLCRRVWVDPVVDKGKLYQDNTYAPSMSILQRHILQKGMWTTIVHNGGTLHVKRKHNADTTKCYYLQTNLQSCQKWNNECGVFSFLQEMIGNNVCSIQVRRDNTQSFSFNQYPFISPEKEALQQICLLRVRSYTNCSISIYSDLYIEKNREEGEMLREDQESFPIV